MSFQFTKEELARYSRHLILPEIGIEGQTKLKNAKVLVVGAGGLGAPLLQYLSAAGVGTIGIIDDDIVEDSNLQRQVLFNVDDLGRSKAEVAKKRLSKLNPHIDINVYSVKLTSNNALEIIKEYDIVADGTDNFPTRYLVNDACVLLNKINVYASIFQFEGQVSVFNYGLEPNDPKPNYRDIFPEPPPPGMVPSCAEGGVLGVLPGIIGSMQANEVIKLVTGCGEPLSGKLLVFDALSMDTRIITFDLPLKRTSINELIDYEDFCNIGALNKSPNEMKEITALELHQLLKSGEEYQLIDVREQHEFEIAEMGGTLIPMGQIAERIDEINKDKKVIIHCRSGARSGQVIQYLEQNHQFDNLYNLKGGILAWADQVDPSLTKY